MHELAYRRRLLSTSLVLLSQLGQVSIETCLESFTRSENISDVHCNVCAKVSDGIVFPLARDVVCVALATKA